MRCIGRSLRGSSPHQPVIPDSQHRGNPPNDGYLGQEVENYCLVWGVSRSMLINPSAWSQRVRTIDINGSPCSLSPKAAGVLPPDVVTYIEAHVTFVSQTSYRSKATKSAGGSITGARSEFFGRMPGRTARGDLLCFGWQWYGFAVIQDHLVTLDPVDRDQGAVNLIMD